MNIESLSKEKQDRLEKEIAYWKKQINGCEKLMEIAKEWGTDALMYDFEEFLRVAKKRVKHLELELKTRGEE